KGAAKLLTQFKNLEDLYAHLDQVEGKSTSQKLKDGKENAFLSRKLVTIVTDMDLNLSLDDLKLQPVKKDDLRALLTELEFKTMERFIVDHAPVVEVTTVVEKVVVSAPQFVAQEKSVELQQLPKLIPPQSSVWAVSIGGGISLGVGQEILQPQGD